MGNEIKHSATSDVYSKKIVKEKIDSDKNSSKPEELDLEENDLESITTDNSYVSRNIEEDEDYGNCPECGAKLKLTSTRRGLMLGCSNYPVCKYMTAYNQPLAVKVEKLIEGRVCPLCGGTVAVKSGRYGLFIGCTNYPECQYIFRDEHSKIKCPECGKGHVSQRKTRYNKVFWACDRYPDCRFRSSFPPRSSICSECGCKLMLEKKGRSGKYLCCYRCGHKELIV